MTLLQSRSVARCAMFDGAALYKRWYGRVVPPLRCPAADSGSFE